jgi:hypothetical protein
MLMVEDPKFADYFSKLITVVNQMKACGETITEQYVVEKEIRTVSLKFKFIVISIQESKDVKAMNFS